MKPSNKLIPAIFPEFHCVALFIIYTCHPTMFFSNGCIQLVYISNCVNSRVADKVMAQNFTQLKTLDSDNISFKTNLTITAPFQDQNFG